MATVIGPPTFEQWKNLRYTDLECYFTHLIKDRHYKVRTIRRIYSVLHQLATFQKRSGQLSGHSIEGFEPPVLHQEALAENEYVSNDEAKRLLKTLTSAEGLSERQQAIRPLIAERNLLIVKLFLYYGLSLQEAVLLTMNRIQFQTKTLEIVSETKNERSIQLSAEDHALAYRYYETIPAAVRPRYHSQDPFFVAFDFQRKTYRWSYELDQPKAWTEIAVQKMLRLEVKRAGLRKGISAQSLRNTFILQKLREGMASSQLLDILGFQSELSLLRYVKTIQEKATDSKKSARRLR